MDQYKLQYQKGSGTFSVVFTAVSLKTGKHVAIKCMKKKFQSIEKVKKLKELQALNILSTHQNIVKLIEALYDQPTGKLALVFQLMDMNLYQSLKSKKNPMTYQKIKFYMFQVLKAIQLMHRTGIFHRDIKPENILVKGNVVKLADFGSCKGKHSTQPYTDYISTRWYRAPQCLMTDGYYNEKMDIWGFGCVLFQLVTKKPLFPGKNQLDQVHRILNIMGTPKKQLLQKYKSLASHMEINFPQKAGVGLEKFLPSSCPKDLIDLLYKLLAFDIQSRISAQQAIKHEYFAEFTSQLDTTTPVGKSKDFRSTFFSTMKDHQGRKKGEDTDQSKGKKQITKQKHFGSKNNLQKTQEDHSGLPKISNGLTNTSQLYKKTFYTKKYSNDFNFTIFNGKKAH